ncbi:hypothetical protein [Acidiphilium sp.]|uniref:hypothetical protein n=1 Tax=Acidiphilium sp. TaxID=527 RepID=UPI003D035433
MTLPPRAVTNRHLIPILALIVLPIAANGLMLAGITHGNPAIFVMFLTRGLVGGWLPGAPGWRDPTIGLITQPLGMLSARDWLHGIVPWWNPYSGVGMPLAAEMQTMSFFLPFVLLLKFWGGWLALKLIIQILCGLFTYALLIELRLTRLAAGLGALFFALSPTIYLVPHVMGPLPFAPLLLLGIERADRAARDSRGLGFGLIPVALAYSIYGGYPEVAYADATLAAVWTIWRFAGAGAARWRFARKIVLGCGIGLVMSLPLVVPFFQYVRLSYLGQHADLYSWIWLLPPGAPLQLFPFIYGPIGALTPPGVSPVLSNLITASWNQLGGWFGPLAALLGLAAIIRPGRLRGLGFVLTGFILVWQLRIWGFPPAVWLIDRIPLMARTNAIRFSGPAMELACFILLAITVDRWQTGGAFDRRAVWCLSTLGAAIGLFAVLPALRSLIDWFAPGTAMLGFALGATGIELALAVAAVTLLTRPPGRATTLALTLVVGTECFATAALSQFAAPRHGTIDLSGVAYLQRHLRLARLYSLQPFGPNYPAAFGLAAIDENELPVPAAWNDYIHRHLDPYADVVMFTGSQARSIGCTLLPRAAAALRDGVFIRPQRSVTPPDQSAELRRHLAAYGAIGVKYVLTPPDQNPFVTHADLPVTSAGQVPFALPAGGVLSGDIPAGTISLRHVDRVDVLIGTYDGAARGALSVQLCTRKICATGHAELATAQDDHFLAIKLDHRLDVPVDAGLRYRFTHRHGAAVAIWLGSFRIDAPPALAVGGIAPPHAPLLRLIDTPRDAPPLVFANQVMRIYRLDRPREFFTTVPACHLTRLAIDAVDADCPAPARLLRLEAYYPGWHARIAGRAVPIERTESIFQSVALPAGRSKVRFFYRPPFIRISCAMALAGLAMWLGLMLASVLRARRARR